MGLSMGLHVHTASGSWSGMPVSATLTVDHVVLRLTHDTRTATCWAVDPSELQCALGVYTHAITHIPAAHITGILVSLVLCAGTPGWQRGYACMERLGTLATTLSERNGTERNGTDRNGTKRINNPGAR